MNRVECHNSSKRVTSEFCLIRIKITHPNLNYSQHCSKLMHTPQLLHTFPFIFQTLYHPPSFSPATDDFPSSSEGKALARNSFPHYQLCKLVDIFHSSFSKIEFEGNEFGGGCGIQMEFLLYFPAEIYKGIEVLNIINQLDLIDTYRYIL